MRLLIALQNFNGERWLAECLAAAIAVRRCSYEDKVDICLLDAGSEDRSLEIASNFPDIDLIKHERLSQSQAMNLAIKSYDFDWFAFCNNDDHMFPQWLQAHKKVIEKNPDADLLHAYCMFWLETQRQPHLPDPFSWEEKMKMAHNLISQPTICISKKCFDKYGIFDESYVYTYDWEYTTRIWKNGGKIVVTPEPLAFYRSRPDNMSQGNEHNTAPEWKRIGRENCGVPDPR